MDQDYKPRHMQDGDEDGVIGVLERVGPREEKVSRALGGLLG